MDQHTVLLITYNNLYLKDEMFCKNGVNFLYEIIRSWLKDGYNFNGSVSNVHLSALVFAETKEDLRDFCMCGTLVQKA